MRKMRAALYADERWVHESCGNRCVWLKGEYREEVLSRITYVETQVT
jgi:hypothetical protein